jgi:hypothetical protein
MNAPFLRPKPFPLIQKPPIGRSRHFLFLCIALVYGLLLSHLPDDNFLDFKNYLTYAEASLLNVASFTDLDLLRILSNEPVWMLLNAALRLILDPDQVLRTIIFFGAASVSWLILRHYPQSLFWLILLLFLPQVVKNHLIHLRQGTAIAVFLWGWFAVNRSSRWLLIGLSPFIHASFFFVLALLVLARFLSYIRFPPYLSTTSYIVPGIVVGLALGFLAEFFGARQAGEYDFEPIRTGASGLGFMLWLTIIAIMLSSGPTWLRQHTFESGIVIFYLATYWRVEVAARIFESGLLIVLMAGLTLHGWRRHVLLGMVCSSGAFEFLSRIGLPALGFASR